MNTLTPAVVATADDVLDPRSLQTLSTEIARRHPAPLTRSTWASVYRAFCALLGPSAAVDALTAESVRAYRDLLECQGRSPATIAKYLPALRTLATTLGVGGVDYVHGAPVARGSPRALSAEQYARLLRMPDRRSTAGKRDPALLHLLGTAGLRRAEACALLLDDVDERQRAKDGRLRRALPRSTGWWVTVRYGKRGHRTRARPLAVSRPT